MTATTHCQDVLANQPKTSWEADSHRVRFGLPVFSGIFPVAAKAVLYRKTALADHSENLRKKNEIE